MFGLGLATEIKIVIGLVIAAGIGIFYMHYRAISAEAAQVPALTARIADDDKRASDLSTKLAQADAARTEADHALTLWQTGKADIINAVRKEGRRAAASTNPVCAPSPDDRKLRNDALVHLVGTQQPGSATGVSNAAGTAH